ncbi:MAG: inositol monophosphatase [Phycisphaerales bacterium]|nr:MAG: inositol monophosphatase [Phycisphaerales bacterium]
MHLEQQDLSQILETAIVAARLAGQRAMEEIHYVKATLKHETELVTETDRRCQQIIVNRIRETFPDAGFIGEEGEPGQIFKRGPRGEPALWWVIDPIDGTNNFAHGIPIFAVSIGVLLEGRPVAGVVFNPATDSMYTAVAGGEAQLDGRRIQSGTDDIKPVTSVGLDSHFGSTLPVWVQLIVRQCRFRNFGTTALQMAYVAGGGLVGMIACTPKLWDIAAGAALAEASGATITDWQGQPLFPIEPAEYEGKPFQLVAANQTAHPKLLEYLKW